MYNLHRIQYKKNKNTQTKNKNIKKHNILYTYIFDMIYYNIT